jgi:hypothetical protein
LNCLFVVTILVILGISVLLWVRFERRQTEARALALREFWVGNRFQRVQLIGTKVLLTPAPPRKNPNFSGEMELSDSSSYWRKPRTVNVGFKFSFSDGAKTYFYEIVGLKPDGVALHFNYSGEPPRFGGEPREVLLLRWK